MVKKKFESEKILGPKFFWTQIFVWPKNFFDPKYFLALNFWIQKYRKQKKI